jgi:hypothetical protein
VLKRYIRDYQIDQVIKVGKRLQDLAFIRAEAEASDAERLDVEIVRLERKRNRLLSRLKES